MLSGSIYLFKKWMNFGCHWSTTKMRWSSHNAFKLLIMESYDVIFHSALATAVKFSCNLSGWWNQLKNWWYRLVLLYWVNSPVVLKYSFPRSDSLLLAFNHNRYSMHLDLMCSEWKLCLYVNKISCITSILENTQCSKCELWVSVT